MIEGNSFGDCLVDNAADMAAFDALPEALRAVLRDAPYDLAAGPELDAVRAGRPVTAEKHQLLDFLRRERNRRLRETWPGHPMIEAAAILARPARRALCR